MPAANNNSEQGVDFYVLKAGSDPAVVKLACRVVEKAYKSGYRVLFMGRDEQHCDQLDEQLWTFSQGSFIPHERGVAATAARVRIAPSPVVHDIDVIVTLNSSALDSAFHHLRIADIIGASDTEKREARERYKFYRSHGIGPRTHHI